MARVVHADQLPQLTSTRDTRDRVDLITEDIFGLTDVRADRITYHPGDPGRPEPGVVTGDGRLPGPGSRVPRPDGPR